VVYASSSSALATGSALTFNGTNLSNTRSLATAFSGANAATWVNGIVLTNTATPATGVSNLITFGGTSNVYSVFGVTQGSSSYGEFVWANYSGSFSELMRLTSTGLGIGTSSPDGLLTLAATNSNTPRLRFQHPSNDADASIDTYQDGGGTYLSIGTNAYQTSAAALSKFDAAKAACLIYFDNAGSILSYTATSGGSITERTRISVDGTFRVKGAGTAGSTDAFQVSGSASASAVSIDSSGNLLVGTTSKTGFQSGVVSQVDAGGAGVYSRQLIGHSNGTGSGEAYQSYLYNGSSIGSVTQDGTAGVKYNTTSSGTTGAQLLNSGVAFPATQVASADANTLDDYEEGTWTPNQGAGLTVVGAFSSSGKYTKIGRIVTVRGTVTGATSVSVVAAGVITNNLPFSCSGETSGTSVASTVTASAVNLADAAILYSAGAIAATGSIWFSVTYTV
jgi:hypothetical protein